MKNIFKNNLSRNEMRNISGGIMMESACNSAGSLCCGFDYPHCNKCCNSCTGMAHGVCT